MAKARFISRFGAYSVGIQRLIQEHFGTGEARTIQRRLDANFHNSLVTDEDFAVAVSRFSFSGLPEDFDTAGLISPRFRVSVWDSEWARESEGYSDEEIDKIIEKLRSDSGFGVDHIELIPQPKAAPWPSYDDASVEEILQVVKVTGLDPQTVVAYERENADRTELLERLVPTQVDDDVVVVQA